LLTPLTRQSLTLDPLIAEAKERGRKRQALIVRLVISALIFGAALAGAAFLQHLRIVENASDAANQLFLIVRPWWLYAAIVALCLLGLAGVASVLATARRAAAGGYTAASALFMGASVAALADTRLTVWINGGMIGRDNLAVVLLLLGVVSGSLAWNACSGSQRQRHPHS
jgi:lysylphosphatidylglycerol synthetase-like protein (DUF2156 family)